MIQRFRDKAASVFLISLKAGGFGLNLAEADYCFVLDPWWNPATEAQAVDRTHRIGQTKTVMVYRLVAKDTIEQKVMDLKARKEELFDRSWAAKRWLARRSQLKRYGDFSAVANCCSVVRAMQQESAGACFVR